MALVRAVPLSNALASALSTTAVSTGYNVGAAIAGQKVYAALHVMPTAGSGATSTARVLSMVVQSASSSGFGGATARITFTLSTAQGAQWGTPVAPSTDHPWWRTSWTMSTVASTGGSWKWLVHMGLK